MMGMPMTPGGGGGKFNTVAARPNSGAMDRNIPNSWNRSHDDSKCVVMVLSSELIVTELYGTFRFNNCIYITPMNFRILNTIEVT